MSGNVLVEAADTSGSSFPNTFTANLDGTTQWTGNLGVSGANPTTILSTADITLSDTAQWTGTAVSATYGRMNITLSDSARWTGSTFNATNVTVNPGATWSVTDDPLFSIGSTITGSLTNSGTVAFDSGGPFKTLTTANYIGNGGVLNINTALGDNNSQTDKLIINGGTATGPTNVVIANKGGPGAMTSGNGIPIIVTTNGATTAADSFTGGTTTAGVYQYLMSRGTASGGTQDDQNTWYLRSHAQGGNPPPCHPADPNCREGPPPPCPDCNPGPGPGPGPGPQPVPLYRPEASLFSAISGMAREMSRSMIAFHDGNGDQALVRGGNGSGPWARGFGQTMKHAHAGTLGTSFDGRMWGFQTGFDIFEGETIAGFKDRFGVFMGYAEMKGDVHGFAIGQLNAFTGAPKLEALSFGGYWTRVAPSDWYIETRVMGTRYDGEALSAVNNLGVSTKGEGVTASLETGYPIPLGYGLTIEPQVQAIYSYLDLDGRDRVSNVDYDLSDAFYLRAGVRLASDSFLGMQNVRPYLKANIWQDFNGSDRAIFDAVHVMESRQRLTAIEAGGGITAQISQNVGLWGMVDYTTDIAGNAGSREIIRGNVGMRITW